MGPHAEERFDEQTRKVEVMDQATVPGILSHTVTSSALRELLDTNAALSMPGLTIV